MAKGTLAGLLLVLIVVCPLMAGDPAVSSKPAASGPALTAQPAPVAKPASAPTSDPALASTPARPDWKFSSNTANAAVQDYLAANDKAEAKYGAGLRKLEEERLKALEDAKINLIKELDNAIAAEKRSGNPVQAEKLAQAQKAFIEGKAAPGEPSPKTAAGVDFASLEALLYALPRQYFAPETTASIAKELAQEFVGKTVRLTGRINSVTLTEDTIFVEIKVEGARPNLLKKRTFAMMASVSRDRAPSLEKLSVGAIVELEGKIEQISSLKDQTFLVFANPKIVSLTAPPQKK